jgi:hypothetical protein
MAENQKGFRFLKRLAEIADLSQSTFKGRSTVIFELDNDEYQKAIDQVENADWMAEQFKIEISGTDFIFLLQKSSPDDKENLSETRTQ